MARSLLRPRSRSVNQSAEKSRHPGRSVPSAYTTSIDIRSPARREVEAAKTFGAVTSSLSIDHRGRSETVCVDVPLGVPDSHDADTISWFNTFPFIPSSFVVGGGSTRLIGLSLTSTNVFSAFQTSSLDLIPVWENNPTGITLIAGNGEVTVGSPNAPDNSNQDDDAPYGWILGTSDRASLATWLGTYTGDSVTLRLCGATVQYHRVQADRTYDAASYTAAVMILALRSMITADNTFGAASYTTTAQVRVPDRLEVTADQTYSAPAYTTTLTLAQRHPLTASVAYAAASYADVVAAIRNPARLPVTATTTFPAFTVASTVQSRAPPRHQVELVAYTEPAPTYAASVQRTDELQLSDFPGQTLTADWLVLLQRTTTGTRLYRSSARNGSDTPLGWRYRDRLDERTAHRDQDYKQHEPAD